MLTNQSDVFIQLNVLVILWLNHYQTSQLGTANLIDGKHLVLINKINILYNFIFR